MCGEIDAACKVYDWKEVARQIIVVLSTEFGIPLHLVIASMRDRALVNDITMRTVYNQLIDIGCFFYTIH